MCREVARANGVRGFSLIELVVSTLLTIVVMAALFQLINQAHSTFFSEPESADATQKARAIVDSITRDLLAAGADLSPVVPAVAPFRRGVLGADPPESLFADRLSVIYAPVSAARTFVSGASNAWNQLLVADQPGCPTGNPLCGFRVDDLAVVSDEGGAYDVFRIVRVESGPPAALVASANLSKLYGPAASVIVVVSATYWLDVDRATGSGLVRKYDGDRTDGPVLDDVGGLMFEYFGSNGRIDPAHLKDGPWQPDGVFSNRYDADLLLVRRIRATVRVRAGRRLLAPSAFETIQFDIAPRNVNRR